MIASQCSGRTPDPSLSLLRSSSKSLHSPKKWKPRNNNKLIRSQVKLEKNWPHLWSSHAISAAFPVTWVANGNRPNGNRYIGRDCSSIEGVWVPFFSYCSFPLGKISCLQKKERKLKMTKETPEERFKKRRTAAARVAGVGWLLVNAKKSPWAFVESVFEKICKQALQKLSENSPKALWKLNKSSLKAGSLNALQTLS